MSISLLHIATFVAVAEAGSMSGAAAQLAFSVSTISDHVAALERQLRVTLFRRTGRGVVMTQAGHRALLLGRAMLCCEERLTEVATVPTPSPHRRQRARRHGAGAVARAA